MISKLGNKGNIMKQFFKKIKEYYNQKKEKVFGKKVPSKVRKQTKKVID